MNLGQYNLSDEERALLIKTTDFGVPLYELLREIELSDPASSSSKAFENAKRVVLSVIEKD